MNKSYRSNSQHLLASGGNSPVSVNDRIDSYRHQQYCNAKSCKYSCKNISYANADSLFDRNRFFQQSYTQIQETSDSHHISRIVVRNKQNKQRNNQTRIVVFRNELFREIKNQRKKHISVEPHDLKHKHLGIKRERI